MSFAALLLLLLFTCACGADVYINIGDRMIFNFSSPSLDIANLMSLCQADPTCSYARGLTLGGQNAVDAFGSLLNSNPPSVIPIKQNYGIADVLNNTIASDADGKIKVLELVYSILVALAGCRYDSVPAVIIPSSAICVRDPSLPNFVPTDNYTLLILLLGVLDVLSVVGLVIAWKTTIIYERDVTFLEKSNLLN
jgi:hypothetical protein